LAPVLFAQPFGHPSPGRKRPTTRLENHNSHWQNLTWLKYRSVSPMSALGQKQTLRRSNGMSVIPAKAAIDGRRFDVRFVPKADMALS
jgi:hypothetical protein